jgi:hypothetical protein
MLTSASADFGVNVGVSGQAGIFSASAKKNLLEQLQKDNGSEHGSSRLGFDIFRRNIK